MRLGKRGGSGLRIQLSGAYDATAASSPPSQQVQSAADFGPAHKRLRNASPESGPLTPASPPVQSPLNESAEPTTHPSSHPPRLSNFARTGCLSPTDSAPLSLKALARGKALSESEEAPPPTRDELAKAPEQRERIGPYVLLSKLDGRGSSFHAYHVAKKTISSCQVLSTKQLAHLLQVRQRLNTAKEADEETLTAILPSGCEIVAQGGRHFLFAPQSFGSLHSYVQSRKRLDEAKAKGLFAQIVRIVALCHELGIVVRDLKLRQFVFADAAQTRLRMGWVGDMVVLAEGASDRLSDRHGCPAYVSPEILDLGQASHSGKAADVWSLGVLLYVVLLGRYPFYDQTPARLFSKIRAGQFWIPSGDEAGISLQARLLLRGLLRRDPSQRPSAALLRDLPWLHAPAASAAKGPAKAARATDEDQVVPCL